MVTPVLRAIHVHEGHLRNQVLFSRGRLLILLQGQWGAMLHMCTPAGWNTNVMARAPYSVLRAPWETDTVESGCACVHRCCCIPPPSRWLTLQAQSKYPSW